VPSPKRRGKPILSTQGKQLAPYVVLCSLVRMAADLIENYEQNMDPFQFMKDVPANWSENVDEAATRLMGEGAIRRTIVVGIWNTPKLREHAPAKAFGALPARYLDRVLDVPLRFLLASGDAARAR
jgi:hypothetical protein